MTIEVIEGAFCVCKIAEPSQADMHEPFTFLCRTDQELSLVCRTDKVPPSVLQREDGWALMRILGPLDFSLIGILSGVSTLLAREGISLFAVSTFDTDYFMVKAESLEKAITVLDRNGFSLQKRKEMK